MSAVAPESLVEAKTACYHCGDPCEKERIVSDDKSFCCQGCKTVYEILSENQLCDYYNYEQNPGLTQKTRIAESIYDFLDNARIKAGLIEFSGQNHEKVTFSIPAIHCSSCIWLLENLERLNEGIINSQVNFTQKEASIDYRPEAISLREVAELLDRIGYPPVINLDDNGDEKQKEKKYSKRLILKMGIAGFCFGNIMLLSFPDYLGLTGIEQTYQNFFRYLNVILAIPAVFYAGSDYFVSAFKSLRQRYANIDIPIALGVSVLFLRSAYEVFAGIGSGYFDSLAGLIFFLLIGKWFQNKTYQTLSFDRDYKSYFPLAVLKKIGKQMESVPVAELEKGDEIAIRNNEIIPADAILIDDKAAIDYSFITGESEPVWQEKGDYIYAGGRLTGPMTRLIVQKEVSQSYLTRLWNDDAFDKEATGRSMVDRISKYFTLAVIAIAMLSAVFWQFADPAKTWLVFTAVLIVACPCALALVTPFTTGSIMRVFGKNRFYLRNADVVERFNEVNTLVFDKTGTITHTDSKTLIFVGEDLSQQEKALIRPLVAGSTHPLSRLILDDLGEQSKVALEHFEETAGKGIQASVNGVSVRLGSASFVGVEKPGDTSSTRVYLSIDGMVKGYFQVQSRYREGIDECVQRLAPNYKLAVLSGDHSHEELALRQFFPLGTLMKFDQSPESKLQVISQMQQDGCKVVMLGDGLNDAGALRQSDVGIAITDDIAAFSPASDAILEASALPRLDELLKLAKSSRKVIKASFMLSFIYNFIGISLAVMGVFTPLIAAVLMPLSSITIVVFTTASVHLFAKRFKLT